MKTIGSSLVSMLVSIRDCGSRLLISRKEKPDHYSQADIERIADEIEADAKNRWKKNRCPLTNVYHQPTIWFIHPIVLLTKTEYEVWAEVHASYFSEVVKLQCCRTVSISSIALVNRLSAVLKRRGIGNSIFYNCLQPQQLPYAVTAPEIKPAYS